MTGQMERNQYIEIQNNSPSSYLKSVPDLDSPDFIKRIEEGLKGEEKHCIAYFGVRSGSGVKLFCFIADDLRMSVEVFSHEISEVNKVLPSVTPVHPQIHIFEREINENFGIFFEGHPWFKPVRFAHNRADQRLRIKDYPFYRIESEELHEVGVGPVHAGIIEPGHFRFICNGEKVLHLEIQLGYQHRGVESLFVSSGNPLRKCLLSESVAGDTAAGHALAHSQLIESLADIDVSENLQIERCIALELERIAVHIGDTAALCGDVAYQPGQVVNEALRTKVINTTQFWCGNRFSKGLIRPGGTNYPLTEEVAEEILRVADDIEKRFGEISEAIYTSPSVLSRFDEIGKVTRRQSLLAGLVGPSARMCGIPRDVRKSHPFQYYRQLTFEPVTLNTGDVLARGMIRSLEIMQSLQIVRNLINEWSKMNKQAGRPVYNYKLKPDSFAVSLVEGWRGEICHIAMTDTYGNIFHYKIKDPSMHNWMALALAVRNQEISDFPVCNKSFNLSYCGHDL